MNTDDRGAEAAEKILIEFGAEETVAAGKDIAEPTVGEIQARIAGKVRADGEEHGALTPSEVVFALVPGSQQDKITALLEGMAVDDRYADIKAVTTASGMVFFVSTTYIDTDEAFAKSRIEEGKEKMAEKVRGDSRVRVALTPAGALYALMPETEQDKFAACLGGMRTEARYADIQEVTASNGDLYFHSDIGLSGNYAKILLRAMANDPCATIAETVRDASRIYPKPTNCLLFRKEAFGIAPDELEAITVETLRKPEFSDIKRMVHPSTGAAYLYSSRYMDEAQVWTMIDWIEVGEANNP